MSILKISKNNKILIETNEYKNYKYEQFKFKDIKIELLNDRVLYKNEKLIGYNEDKSICGFIIGEIYDLEVNKLKQKGHKFNTELDAEYIVHLYEEYGEDVLKSLNGKFIICLIDTLNENIIIVNDRYGTINFYYNIEKNNFIFTNHSKTVLSNIKDKIIDEEAVEDFLNYGCVIKNKTLLKSVKRMDAASIIKINNDNITVDKYWDWNIKKLENVTFNESVDKLGKLWIEAVRKIVSKHEKLNITVTGGLDSRAVVAAIDYLNLNYKINLAYTIGLKGCLDGKIAQKIAQRASLNYKFFPINNKQYLINSFKALQNTVCPLITDYVCINNFNQKELLKYPLLSGYLGGETIGGDLLEDNLNYLKADKTISYIYNNQSKMYGISDKKLFLEECNLNISSHNKYVSTDFHILGEFLIRNRSAVLFEMMGNNYNNLSPFMDNNLIDYLYSLPEEWRKGHHLYNAMLLKFFPKFYIDIPWERTKLPIILDLNEAEIELYSKEKSYEMHIKNKDIIIFGASTLGIKAYKLLKNNYNVIYYCDNDSKKWGKLLENIEIISPDKLAKLNNVFVVVASMYYKEILHQLKDLGIRDYTFIGIEEGNVKSYTNFSIWLKNEYIYKTIKNEIVNNNFIKKYINIDYFTEKIHQYICNDKGRYEDILLIFSLSKVLEKLTTY